MVRAPGFEPGTNWLRASCSTTELRPLRLELFSSEFNTPTYCSLFDAIVNEACYKANAKSLPRSYASKYRLLLTSPWYSA